VEPLDALTNLAFLVAAVAMVRPLRRTPDLDWRNGWGLWRRTGLLVATGIGSGLWHNFAAPRGLLADVLPIAFFINLCPLVFGWRVLAFGWHCPVAQSKQGCRQGGTHESAHWGLGAAGHLLTPFRLGGTRRGRQASSLP